MSRWVYECTTYDTASATCSQAVWVERQPFPELSVADALILLSSVALLFVVAGGWRLLGRQTRTG